MSLCKTCRGSGSNDCLSCQNGYGFGSGTTSNTCFKCLINQYTNALSKCVYCDISCKTCNDLTAKNCLSCPIGKCLISGACTLCPVVAVTAMSCHESCETCSGPGPNNCTSCATGRAINEDNSCSQSVSALVSERDFWRTFSLVIGIIIPLTLIIILGIYFFQKRRVFPSTVIVNQQSTEKDLIVENKSAIEEYKSQIQFQSTENA